MVKYAKIKDCPGYLVSSTGKVWSKRIRHGKRKEWKRLNPKPDPTSGYVYVNIWNSKKKLRRRVAIHYLVLESFVGPRPYGHVARHFPDPTKTNNRLDNLSWSTQKVNIADCVKDGSLREGSKHGMSKLKEDYIPIIVRLASLGVPQIIIAKAFGVHNTNIPYILSGKTWKHITKEIKNGKETINSR